MRFTFETFSKIVIKEIYLTVRGCALKVLGLLLFQKKSVRMPANIENILFIRVDRIGDMVLSTPAFEAIKIKWPKARLTLMASKANAPIVKNNPYVDEVIIYDRFATLPEKIRILKGLRARHFDLAIDPHDDYEMKTAWMAWMSGAGHRIGYAAYGREVLFNISIPATTVNQHFVDTALALIKHIGVTFDNRHPSINLGEEERLWAKQWVIEKGLRNRMLVAVHPGAFYETQRWPTEYFADLIRLIREQTKAEVIIFGGPADAAVIEDILSRLYHPVVVSIQSDIRSFLALLSSCRILVCNNSGPLHCAVAINVHSISFMGPTDNERWRPIGDNHHVLRKDNLPCIGCNLGTCKIKTHDCMRLITPQTVMDLFLDREASVFDPGDMTATRPV
jgi:lipopolysaccharide heptosyltransferase II